MCRLNIISLGPRSEPSPKFRLNAVNFAALCSATQPTERCPFRECWSKAGLRLKSRSNLNLTPGSKPKCENDVQMAHEHSGSAGSASNPLVKIITSVCCWCLSLINLWESLEEPIQTWLLSCFGSAEQSAQDKNTRATLTQKAKQCGEC